MQFLIINNEVIPKNTAVFIGKNINIAPSLLNIKLFLPQQLEFSA
jgi:hypothetical protein